MDRPKTDATAEAGVAVITVPDNRWERVDIKSVSLLPNVLARQAARDQGAREAWFVDRDGFVTEGASSNAWIVTKGGKVVTRPLHAWKCHLEMGDSVYHPGARVRTHPVRIVDGKIEVLISG